MDNKTPTQVTFSMSNSVNPCSSITSVDCGNNTVCLKSSDSTVGLWLANTSKFVIDDNEQHCKYTVYWQVG